MIVASVSWQLLIKNAVYVPKERVIFGTLLHRSKRFLAEKKAEKKRVPQCSNLGKLAALGLFLFLS